MTRRPLLLCAIVGGTGLAVLAASFYRLGAAASALRREVRLAGEDAERIRAQALQYSDQDVPARAALADLLLRTGLEWPVVSNAVVEARRVYDLRRIRAGNRLVVARSVTGEVREVIYQIDDDRELWIGVERSGARAELRTSPHTIEVVTVAGEIRDSLFSAASDAGEDPMLALELAEIFGWDLDFYSDPRPGDTFRAVLEKKIYARDGEMRVGRILAAEYNNQGRVYRAVLFRDPSGRPAYYAPDGKSLKKVFLRSPLKFGAAITSRFSRRRFHPILKRHRPHLGIDYSAPTGTPVQALGDGRVVFAGWNGQSGKVVQLRHGNGYKTFYLHLSRIMVRPGQRVQQGQIIGLVGSTGLATGPHVDLRIHHHGRFRNLDSLRLPPAHPVAKNDWEEFVLVRDRWLNRLPEVPESSLRAERRAGQPGSASEN